MQQTYDYSLFCTDTKTSEWLHCIHCTIYGVQHTTYIKPAGLARGQSNLGLQEKGIDADKAILAGLG
jgi:hypothetical protein